MLDQKPTLSSIFTGWLSENGGIFAYLDASNLAPWSDNVDPESLDRIYFGQRSGDKFASKYVRMFLVDGELSVSAREKIAADLYSRYSINWVRLWQTTLLQYQALNSFDVTTTRAVVRADNEAELVGTDFDGTSELEHGLSNTLTHGKTVGVSESQYGFDSTGPVPTNETSSEEGGTTTSTDSGTDTTTIDNHEDRNRQKVNVGNENENVRKFGNVGTTTPQRLISEERDVWLWKYFDSVFRDLDEMLALKVYWSEYG